MIASGGTQHGPAPQGGDPSRAGLLHAAGLASCLMGALAPGGCTAHADETPPGAHDEPRETSTAVCIPSACDPLCVDVGRYRVTAEVVDDLNDGHRLWQRRAVARLPWDDAVHYCATLTLEGRGGWRLPSPLELNGIRFKPGGLFGGGSSRHYCIPSIDQAAFPETPAGLFWSSRTMPDDTAWYVGFDDGRMHRDVRTDALWVRCTHDPPPP